MTWLCAETWPFHGRPQLDPQAVRHGLTAGRYAGDDTETFWIADGGHRVGLLVLRELDDLTPTFDLRLRAAARGRGLGRAALAWLAEHLFATRDKPRVEGTTRADNVAMRRAFRAAGWVKEGHHRRAWPDAVGVLHDAVTYAVLRTDWERGETTPVPWDEEP